MSLGGVCQGLGGVGTVSESGVSAQNETAWPPETGEAMGFDVCAGLVEPLHELFIAATILSARLEWGCSSIRHEKKKFRREVVSCGVSAKFLALMHVFSGNDKSKRRGCRCGTSQLPWAGHGKGNGGK